jgi:hypothetical protein
VSSGIRRLFAIALSGVAALAAALALIVIFGNGLSFIGATVATPLGWSIGVVSLVVIGAAGWALLMQPEKDPGRSEEFLSTSCPNCGRNVLVAWRLCPYCGSGAPSPETGLGEDEARASL